MRFGIGGSAVDRRIFTTLVVADIAQNPAPELGHDSWSYGVEPNRKVLDYFLTQHHLEGLSSRRVAVDELFHRATYETFML